MTGSQGIGVKVRLRVRVKQAWLVTAEDGVFAAWVGEAEDAMANSERRCSALFLFREKEREWRRGE